MQEDLQFKAEPERRRSDASIATPFEFRKALSFGEKGVHAPTAGRRRASLIAFINHFRVRRCSACRRPRSAGAARRRGYASGPARYPLSCTSRQRPSYRRCRDARSADPRAGACYNSGRLDFTVVGPAVNEASRIAAMCRSIDQPVLVSSAFAAAAGDAARPRLVSVGRYALRGVARPQELYTLDSTGVES
jgi:hypothetical protein